MVFQHTHASTKRCSTTNSLFICLPFVAAAAAFLVVYWCPLSFAYATRSSTEKKTYSKRARLSIYDRFYFVYHLHTFFSLVWFGLFLWYVCVLLLFGLWNTTLKKYPFTNFNCEYSGRRRCQLVNDQIKYRISTFNSENCPSEFCMFLFVFVCLWTDESKLKCWFLLARSLSLFLFFHSLFRFCYFMNFKWVRIVNCFCLFCLSKKSCSREF